MLLFPQIGTVSDSTETASVDFIWLDFPIQCDLLTNCIVLVLDSFLSILKYSYSYKRRPGEKASGEENTLPLFYMAYQLVLEYSYGYWLL